MVGGNTTNLVPLLKGDGAGGFASFPSFPYNVGTQQPYGILAADFNNDGVTDITFATGSQFGVLLSPPSFRTTWVTTDGQITIPTTGTGYNYDIVWTNLTNTGVGNGAITAVNGDYTITGLANGDTYQVLIRGDFPRIYFNNGPEKDKILTVEEWGPNPWTSFANAFYGCSSLNFTASDMPNLSGVTDLFGMFRNASSFNSDISDWDISKVRRFSNMFQEASAYNNGGVILDWANIGQDASVITISMSHMFARAVAFNQDISGWNISKVQSFQHMFNNASSFNNAGVPLNWTTMGQDPNVINIGLNFMFANSNLFNHDISDWNVRKVSSFYAMFSNNNIFDNGGVTLDWINMGQDAGVNTVDLGYMFSNASAFNQDISTWSVNKVWNLINMFSGTNSFNNGGIPLDWINLGQSANVTGISMQGMFNGASAFNQEIGSWDIGKASSMVDMLSNSGLSTANYDATLIGWADDNSGTETIPSGNTLGATGLTYCTGLSARTDLVSTYGWTISDAGASCPEINVFAGIDNTGAAILDAQVAVIDFGTALQTNNITQTFAIENTGTSTLTISSIAVTGSLFCKQHHYNRSCRCY